MLLMTFNSLLMFDIVFVFFLFLVGVTCLVYYLPPTTRKAKSFSLPDDKSCPSVEYGDVTCAAELVYPHSHYQHHLRAFYRDQHHRLGDIESCVVEDDQYCRRVENRYRCPHNLQPGKEPKNNINPLSKKGRNVFAANISRDPERSPENTTMTERSNRTVVGRGEMSELYRGTPSHSPGNADKDQFNLEVVSLVANQETDALIGSPKSSRHLYHNILNSDFEHDDDDGIESSHSDCAITNREASLPSPLQAPVRIPAPLALINIPDTVQNNNATSSAGIQYPLPRQYFPESYNTRHVFGVCQYHLQKHHQLQQIYQQQERPNNLNIRPSSSTGSVNSTETSISGTEPRFRGVEYVIVDTATDNNKKHLNKYCHVKVHNCDMNKKCATRGLPVDKV